MYIKMLVDVSNGNPEKMIGSASFDLKKRDSLAC